MVEFKGKFNSDVTKAMNNRAFKKTWWLFVVVSLLFILIGALVIAHPEDSSDLPFGIFMIVLGCIFTPLVIVLSLLIQRSRNKTMSIMSSDTLSTFQFFPDRLIFSEIKMSAGDTVSEYEATTSAKYSYLYKVEETKEAYFMFISRVQTHVISKSDLTQGSIEELNQMLASNLGEQFKALKK